MNLPTRPTENWRPTFIRFWDGLLPITISFSTFSCCSFYCSLIWKMEQNDSFEGNVDSKKVIYLNLELCERKWTKFFPQWKFLFMKLNYIDKRMCKKVICCWTHSLTRTRVPLGVRLMKTRVPHPHSKVIPHVSKVWLKWPDNINMAVNDPMVLI